MRAAPPRPAPVAAGWRELALLGTLALVWSSSFMFIKLAVASVPPFSVAAGRLAVAAAMLLAMLALGGRRLPLRPRALALYAVVGLLGNALPFTLIAWGEQTVDSGLAAILMGVMPVATALLAHLLTPEDPLTAGRSLGVALGFAGVVVLVGWQALTGLGQAVLAQLAVLGGALSYAVTTIYVRRHGALAHREMAAGATLAGAVLALVMALALERPWALEPSLASLLAIGYLGVLPTGLAALIYFHLVQRIGATRFAQVNYVLPALGVGWGALFLGERPGPRALAALVLIAAAVALVNARPRR